MDAVILAAGKNERLNGIAAPFHKPLLLVNGEPIIITQFRRALEAASRVFFICAPENIGSIISLLHNALSTDEWGMCQFIVQPHPVGVIDALRRGTVACDGGYVLLMGDNVVPHGLVSEMMAFPTDPCEIMIATQFMPHDQARRFTYRIGNGPWVDHEVASYDEDGATPEVWIGPMIVNGVRWTNAASFADFLNFHTVVTYPADCQDIGVPEALAPPMPPTSIRTKEESDLLWKLYPESMGR